MNLRAVISAYRFQKNRSLSQLASEIGITKMDLFRFESGRDISMGKMARVLRWLLVDEPSKK